MSLWATRPMLRHWHRSSNEGALWRWRSVAIFRAFKVSWRIGSTEHTIRPFVYDYFFRPVDFVKDNSKTACSLASSSLV